MKSRCILFFLLVFGGIGAKAQIFTDSRRHFSYTDDSTVMPGDVKVLEVLFDYNGGCRIFEEYYATLDSLAQYLLRNPQIQVQISVHVDSRGTVQGNQKLTECRGRRVAQCLEKWKVPGTQFTMVSKGEDEPLISDETIAAEPDEETADA